jgi:hypothetical protein
MRARGNDGVAARGKRVGPSLGILRQVALSAGGLVWKGRSTLRTVTIGLVVCAFGVSVIGCGDSQDDSIFGGELTRRVLALDPGVSIESARAKLGEPINEISEGHEDVLNYGSWQLTFVGSHLTRRSRVFVPRHARPIRETQSLRRKILDLSLGMSIAETKAVLGVPESIYVVYDRSSKPLRVLRYGLWELSFTNGSLRQRSQ